jgi:hypothetical protein
MTYPIHAFLETKSAMAGGSRRTAHSCWWLRTTRDLPVYRAPVIGGELTPITAFEEPVSGRYLPGREGTLLVQMDEGGNERHQVYLIEEDGSNFRPVIYEPEFIFRAGGVTRDGRRFAYASNRRNGVDFDIYVHDLESGKSEMVFAPGDWCDASRFSPDGRYLGVIRLTERNGDNDLPCPRHGDGRGYPRSPHEDDAYFSGPTWLGDSSGFYFTTDQDGMSRRSAGTTMARGPGSTCESSSGRRAATATRRDAICLSRRTRMGIRGSSCLKPQR